MDIRLQELMDNTSDAYADKYVERYQKVAKKAYIEGIEAAAKAIEGYPLTLDQYQESAMRTCMRSCDNFSYMFLNLIGEMGELASKVAKDIRKGNVCIGECGLRNDITALMPYDQWEKRYEEYMYEAGDILWQLAGLCKVMNWSLSSVAEMNLIKLASRKERGVIDGNGDNR